MQPNTKPIQKQAAGVTVIHVPFTLPFTLFRNANAKFNLPKWERNAIDNLRFSIYARLLVISNRSN